MVSAQHRYSWKKMRALYFPSPRAWAPAAKCAGDAFTESECDQAVYLSTAAFDRWPL